MSVDPGAFAHAQTDARTAAVLDWDDRVMVDRHAAAYHEAGHAWSYLESGRIIEEVTITPVPNALTCGSVRVRPEVPAALDRANCLLAGPLVEAAWVHRNCVHIDNGCPGEGPDHEYHCIDDYLAGRYIDGCHDLRTLEAAIPDYAHEVAPVMLTAINHVWHRISRLAEVLVIEHQLDGDQVCDLLG